MIRFDFSRLFQPNIEGGLTEKEISEIKPRVEEAIDDMRKNTPGFLRIVNDQEILGQVKELEEWIFNFDDFVVLGIGGSALGNIALHNTLKPLNWNALSKDDRNGFLRVFVVDNVDPDFVSSILQQVDLKHTLFNVISKSGSTAEAMANYLTSRNILESMGLDPKDHLVFTTDPEKGVLRKIAKEEGIRVLDVPPDVGGRFSVLTQVGLLSAMSEGIDIDKLHEGAQAAKNRCLNEDIWNNPAALIAAVHYLFYNKGKTISVMMPYSNRLYYLADWYRQLWAESLGKKYSKDGKVVSVGQTPVKALGTTDQHSQVQLYNEGPNDKVITFIKVERFDRDVLIGKIHDEEALEYLGGRKLSELINAEYEGTRSALTKSGKPNLSLEFDKIDEFNVGYFFVTYECATVIAGWLFNINPYDQPGVELGKKLTYAIMGRKGYEDLVENLKVRKEFVI